MTQLTEYQRLKMYLPVNGYDTLEELASEWDCTVQAIRNNCRGILKSQRLEDLRNDFIERGEKKFQEARNSKVAPQTS